MPLPVQYSGSERSCWQLKIKCVHCSSEFDVADYIAAGTDVLCPYCVRHFKYGEKRESISEIDIQSAIRVCCKDEKKNEYYMKAPCGARLYIALIFYGEVYRNTLDQDAYLSLLEHISKNELKERDLLYLFQYEDEGDLKKYWLDRLVSEYGYDEVVDRSQVNNTIAEEGCSCKISRNAQSKPIKAISSRTKDESFREKTTQYMSANRAEKSSLIVFATCAVVLAVGLFGFLVVQSSKRSGSNPTLQSSSDKDIVEVISGDAAASAKMAGREIDKQRGENLSASCKKILAEVEEMRNACVQARKVVREDAARFQRELNELTTQNSYRAGKAAAENRSRLGNAEYAMMIAKSACVNELYTRYADGNLKSSGDLFRQEVNSLLVKSNMKMNDKISAIDNRADSFTQMIIKNVNDGIRNREREVWEAGAFVQKVFSTANRSESMQRLGSLSDAERVLETIEQDKWQGVVAKLRSLPAAPVDIICGDVGFDEFIACDTLRLETESVELDNHVSESDTVGASRNREDVREDIIETMDISPSTKSKTTSTKSKTTSMQSARASAAGNRPATRRRTKCKSPERCPDFAESGQNFCEVHRCQSYGCKEHRATLTIPAWFDVGKGDRVTGSSIKRDFRKLKIPYCKRHMCQRAVIQPSDRKTAGRHIPYWYDYDSGRFGAKFFFCTNERLAKGKYCLEHVCKVPTCNAPRWEYWVEASAEKVDEREFRGRLPTSLTEFRGLRLKRAETCKGHSAMDPDAIRDRAEDECRTEGDKRKARESGF